MGLKLGDISPIAQHGLWHGGQLQLRAHRNFGFSF